MSIFRYVAMAQHFPAVIYIFFFHLFRFFSCSALNVNLANDITMENITSIDFFSHLLLRTFHLKTKRFPLRFFICVDACALCIVLLNYQPGNHSQRPPLMAVKYRKTFADIQYTPTQLMEKIRIEIRICAVSVELMQRIGIQSWKRLNAVDKLSDSPFSLRWTVLHCDFLCQIGVLNKNGIFISEYRFV